MADSRWKRSQSDRYQFRRSPARRGAHTHFSTWLPLEPDTPGFRDDRQFQMVLEAVINVQGKGGQFHQPQGRRSRIFVSGEISEVWRRDVVCFRRQDGDSFREKFRSVGSLSTFDGTGRDSCEDIIFDPNITTLATGLTNTRLPGLHRSGGKSKSVSRGESRGGGSNISVSSAATRSEACIPAFLFPRSRRAGHGHRQCRNAGCLSGNSCGSAERVEDVLFNRSPDAPEKLLDFA